MNRGVDKRDIFLDSQDYVRFIHDMYEFNKIGPSINNYRNLISIEAMWDLRSPTSRLVNIHGWCLMKNHYHLLLEECVEGGMTIFLRRLNIGYAKYFNERNERVGTLFQGRTKKVLIEREAHFLHILHYIHLNPLDFFSGADEWRAWEVEDAAAALAHLDAWRWSSYLDYSGTRNFPSILETSLFGAVFGNYRETITAYVKNLELDEIEPLMLE